MPPWIIKMVGPSRFELLTPCASSKCSPPELRAYSVVARTSLRKPHTPVKQFLIFCCLFFIFFGQRFANYSFNLLFLMNFHQNAATSLFSTFFPENHFFRANRAVSRRLTFHVFSAFSSNFSQDFFHYINKMSHEKMTSPQHVLCVAPVTHSPRQPRIYRLIFSLFFTS